MNSILELLRSMPEFRPCVYYLPDLDTLVYLERDCSYTEVRVPGSDITLLYSNHEESERLIGVEIAGFAAKYSRGDLVDTDSVFDGKAILKQYKKTSDERMRRFVDAVQLMNKDR